MNNQGNTWKEVNVNTTKTRQTFKVKQETRQTKDRGEETLTKTQKTKENGKGLLCPTYTMTLSQFPVSLKVQDNQHTNIRWNFLHTGHK